MIRRLLDVAIVCLAAWSLVVAPVLPAYAGHNEPVGTGQLPQFLGGECTTAQAGSGLFSCATMRGQANTWPGQQSFTGGVTSNIFVNGTTSSVLGFYASSGGTDQKNWRFITTSAGLLQLQKGTDAGVWSATMGFTAAGLVSFPLGLVVAAPTASDNSSTQPDTSANSQNRLSRVANAAALATWTNYAFPVVRIDTGATYGDTGASCAAADGWQQVQPASGHCWLINWTALRNVASPLLVDPLFATDTSTHQTAAVQAAVATGFDTDIPSSFVPSKQITLSTPGQIIRGRGRYPTRINVPTTLSNGYVHVCGDHFGSPMLTLAATNPDLAVGNGLSGIGIPPGTTIQAIGGTAVTMTANATATNGRMRLVSISSTTNNGIFNVTATEPGPVIREIGFAFVQPDTANNLLSYPPAIYAQAVPRFTLERLGCYQASVCVDMRGNSGGATINDLQMSPFYRGILIDGSYDTVRMTDLHLFPFSLTPGVTITTNQQTASYNPNTIAIDISRCDDCKIRGMLSYIGLGISIKNGSDGTNSFGKVGDADFDTSMVYRKLQAIVPIPTTISQ